MLDLLFSIFLAVFGLFSAGHALLTKLDPRASLGWIVACLALPGIGPVLYWLIGVNRIRMRARDWQARGQGMGWGHQGLCPWTPEDVNFPFRRENYQSLLSLADAVTRRRLVTGNRVTPLFNGEEAYPEMLAAIRGARHSVHLASYIFESNPVGREFVAALRDAAERGVDVRVLIDGLGERYSFPTARSLLRKSKVRVARFLPPSLSNHGIYFNLRNHRKLLIVDDSLGFTGGMNIGSRHMAAALDNPHRVEDIHFRVEGPVVGHLQEAFLEDWGFCTREHLPALVHTSPGKSGSAFCRGVSAGPNEEFEKLHWIIIGALNSARQRVCVMTPYFIPNRAMVSAINSAALRGVQVDIILPRKNNLPFVAWAAEAHVAELLQYGSRIWYQPPPFVHSKLMLVDDDYVLIGSANIDPRSLRLNFEFNLEVYCRELCTRLKEHCDAQISRSRRAIAEEMNERPLWRKLGTNFCKLFSPYL